MVCPILISVLVTPGAFWAAAGSASRPTPPASSKRKVSRINVPPFCLRVSQAMAPFALPLLSRLRETLAVWPDAASNVGNQSELGLLLGHGHRVRILARRKTPLRAQRQPLQRHDLAGLANARLDRVRIFQLAVLGGDEAEHHGGVLSYVAER